MKNRKLLLATLAAITFIGIDAALIFSGHGIAATTTRKLEKGEDQQSITPSRGNIEDIVTAQGTLEPKDYVDVGAQASGQIEKLHVDIGDIVKKGDLIAEIDPQMYESTITGNRAQLKTLSAQKAQNVAELRQAQQKFDRNEKLIKLNAISQETYDDSKTDLDIAKAQLQSTKAQIAQAQATLDGNLVNLSYTKIYAPMDGTVVDSAIKEGQTINASQTTPTIVQIANLDVMTVRTQVAEADISRLKDDMNVYFTTLGSGTRRWNATIRQILPTPETLNDVVLYNVLIDVDNTDHQLMTGMTTQNFFIVAKADNVLTLPVRALGKRRSAQDDDTGDAYEVSLIRGNEVQTAIVHVGLMDRKVAEITAGLSATDRVLPTPSTTTTTSSGPKRMMGPRL